MENLEVGIFENDDGACSVMKLNPNVKTNKTNIERFKKAANGKQFDIIDISEIPTDDYLRKAWKKGDNKIDIDMPKAREIHMNFIREKRNKKLQELDVETLKGNDVQAAKQILRDLPNNLDLNVATTPEELKAIMPEELLDAWLR